MTRPRKRRRIAFSPHVTYFKPRGVPLRTLKEKEIELNPDELEAIRLKYLEDLEQNKCAQKMRVSQSTFQRILAQANCKIAQALIKGWAIKIKKRPTP